MKTELKELMDDGKTPRCQAQAWERGLSFGYFYQCTKRATVDGFCKTHNPQIIESKRAERNRVMREKWDVESKYRNRTSNMLRLFPRLVEALEMLLKPVTTGEQEDKCHALLAEAKQLLNPETETTTKPK